MRNFTYAENADMHCMYGRANGNGIAVLQICDTGRRRAVHSPSLEENTLNVVADRPESSTIAVAHHVSVSHETVCRVLNQNRLHLFHFKRVQALNLADYLLRLPVGGTSMSAPAGLHSSCVVISSCSAKNSHFSMDTIPSKEQADNFAEEIPIPPQPNSFTLAEADYDTSEKKSKAIRKPYSMTEPERRNLEKESGTTMEGTSKRMTHAQSAEEERRAADRCVRVSFMHECLWIVYGEEAMHPQMVCLRCGMLSERRKSEEGGGQSERPSASVNENIARIQGSMQRIAL
ncbi:hypothetical protein TNCV_2834631 [Trichonephila clavipes]|nr:hypothetical protein TNCV_2834631 [Trichonephila clavipes]